jgi:hypothetical protein
MARILLSLTLILLVFSVMGRAEPLHDKKDAGRSLLAGIRRYMNPKASPLKRGAKELKCLMPDIYRGAWCLTGAVCVLTSD